MVSDKDCLGVVEAGEVNDRSESSCLPKNVQE